LARGTPDGRARAHASPPEAQPTPACLPRSAVSKAPSVARFFRSQVPPEDVDELRADWAKAGLDGKKRMVWDMRNLVDEEFTDDSAPPPPPPPPAAAPPPSGGGDEKSELRRRGGKQPREQRGGSPTAADKGGGADASKDGKRRKQRRGGYSCLMKFCGSLLLVAMMLPVLLLTTTAVIGINADKDRPMMETLQSVIDLLMLEPGQKLPSRAAPKQSYVPDFEPEYEPEVPMGEGQEQMEVPEL